MLKRQIICVSVVGAFAIGSLGAQTLENLGSEVSGEWNEELRPYCEFKYDGEDLFITAYNTLGYMDNDEFSTDFSVTDRAITVDDRFRVPSGIPLPTDKCLRTRRYAVRGVGEGLRVVRYGIMAPFYGSVDIGGWMVLTDGFTCSLKEGESVIPPVAKMTDQEWVIYNPALKGGEGDFFRLRLDGKERIDGTEYDVMKMCRSGKWTSSEGKVIAYMKGGAMLPADVDIETEFWGAGYPEPFTNPSEWRMFKYHKGAVDVFFMPTDKMRQFTTTDFVNDRYVMGFCTSSTVKLTDNGVRWEVNVSNTPVGSGDAVRPFNAMWIQNIGPVGDKIAANPCYPQYVLPEGVVASTLLYVRDVTSNEVLWGDASLDPEYQGVHGVTDSNSAFGVYGGKGVVEICCEDEISIYDVKGNKVYGGRGSTQLALTPGIYVALKGERIKKILVR